MRSALHEALRATEPRVYDAPWERWVALMGAERGRADGGAEAAEQFSLRGKDIGILRSCITDSMSCNAA